MIGNNPGRERLRILCYYSLAFWALSLRNGLSVLPVRIPARGARTLRVSLTEWVLRTPPSCRKGLRVCLTGSYLLPSISWRVVLAIILSRLSSRTLRNQLVNQESYRSEYVPAVP